ncbi:MAG: GLUG motif-containing protein [Oscillospiraceae bacterium]
MADGAVSAEWDGTAAASFDGGAGTEADPYRIANGEQLALLAQYVNSNNADYVSAYYTLTADILLNDDINSEPNEWNSIGAREGGWPDSSDRPFRGTFDGASHKVIGLYQTGDSAYGLFSYISESATVKNLSVTDGKIVPGDIGVGAICGFNEGKISNCTNEADVIISTEASGQAGGVCGINNGGTIEYCYNKGDIYCRY